jgi:hypothetical protein
MRKKTLTSLAAFFAISLGGCSQPSYHNVSTFHQPQTASGKACVKRCLEHKTNCDKRCGLDHQQCLMRQKALAHKRFVNYVNQMVQANHKLELNENDFIDYDLCSGSCECIKSYKNCYTLCGGAITERRICVSGCR